MLKRIVLLSALALCCAVPVVAAGLDETWIYRAEVVLAKGEPPRVELLKLEFRPDGGFKLDGRHADEWISYGEGRYYYQPETGEIFVTVASGAYEWPYKGRDDYETLYWAEILESYPLYFKITARDQGSVTVREYVNFYTVEADNSPEGLYQTAPVWMQADGVYRLLDPESMLMRERTYQVEPGQ